MSKTKLEVPFDKEGNMSGYDYGFTESWLALDHTFDASMKYIGYTKGRSSVKMLFIDIVTDRQYEMFLNEFDRLIKLGEIDDSYLSGKFGFSKKGVNYGLRFINKENKEETK